MAEQSRAEALLLADLRHSKPAKSQDSKIPSTYAGEGELWEQDGNGSVKFIRVLVHNKSLLS